MAEESEELPLIYANTVRCSFTFGEFLLDFGRSTPDKEEYEYDVRVVTNPYMMKTLRDTIKKIVKDYEKNYGLIKEPPKGQRAKIIKKK